MSLRVRLAIAYIVLLAVVLGAYIHDSDENRLFSDAAKVKGAISVMEESVQQARLFYLGA